MEGSLVASDADPTDEAHALKSRGSRTGQKSLAWALQTTGTSLERDRTSSETPSEEDYDENVRPSLTAPGGLLRNKEPGQAASRNRVRVVRKDSGIHIYPDDEDGLREFLQRSSARVRADTSVPRKTRFRDMGFTRQLSAFDRNNEASVNSPFHGFYTLFWLSIALFVFKISADNWRLYGHPLGSYEIMKTMFRRDGRTTRCSYIS
jgi:sterol O-acyltransferase